MSTTYAQKQSPAQKKDASSASSVLDSSSQSESLQRKADMANNNIIQCYGMSRNFETNHGIQMGDEQMIALLQERHKADEDIYKNSIVKKEALKKLGKYSDDGEKYGPISSVPCKSAEMNKEGGIIIKNEDFCKVWINDNNDMGHIGDEKPKKGADYYEKERTGKTYGNIVEELKADDKRKREKKEKRRARKIPDADGFRLV